MLNSKLSRRASLRLLVATEQGFFFSFKYIHLQAFLASDELRVPVVLPREIDNVHPVTLIVQGCSGSDVLRLRGT